MPAVTAEMLREKLDYNPETGVLTWKKRHPSTREDRIFNTQFSGKEAGTLMTDRYGYCRKYFRLSVEGRSKTVYCHRAAWGIYHGVMPDGDVDHINGDALDNRIENLRDLGEDRALNQRNCRLSSNNTSGYNGVTKHGNSWVAQVKFNWKRHHLGSFNTPEEADEAVKEFCRGKGFTDRHGEPS